jgi:hypothetical protein
MDSLQEKPKYKIFCNSDDEQLLEIVYTDNSKNNSSNRLHARLNNIIAVTLVKYQGAKQISHSGKIYFLFFDRMNNLSVLMTLDCEQLSKSMRNI